MKDFKEQLLEDFAHIRNKQAFNVVQKLDNDSLQEWTKAYIPAKHLVDRLKRLEQYEVLDLTNDDFVAGFEVDKNHKNGNEIHVINSAGLIYIFNKTSKKFITVLGARPGQIVRYYKALNLAVPTDLINKAFENYKQGVNQK